MEASDESSKSNYQMNYKSKIAGTPHKNKRSRTKSFDNDMSKLPESKVSTCNNQIRNRNIINSKQMMSAIQEYDFPPVSLKFKNELHSTDRQLINELITWWKIQHKKDLNIIGPFGFKKCLLVFANDIDTFNDIVDKSCWPDKIQGVACEMKLSRVFPPCYCWSYNIFRKIGMSTTLPKN